MTLKDINKIYNFHSKFYDITRPFFLWRRKRAINFLNLNKKDRVLDLACGTGMNIPLILKKVTSKNVIGIDYSNHMLEKAE